MACHFGSIWSNGYGLRRSLLIANKSENQKLGKETRIYFCFCFPHFHSMVIDLVVATRNSHKTREIQHILGPEFKVADLGAHPDIPEILESGTSFEENATLKALAASRQLPGLVIADDSGLEVDALGGAPGTYSARYAGANATNREKMDKLLRELSRVRATNDGGRRARFRCVVALARNGHLLAILEGKIDGKISDTARGDSGFGY